MPRFNTNIKEFLDRSKVGAFDADDVTTQINAGWHDWFCRETSLVRKTKKLTRVLKAFLEGNPSINVETHYVWFKNNQPLSGPQYDSIRISEVATGDIAWVIDVKSPHETGKYAIYHSGNLDRPAAVLHSTRELKTETIVLPYVTAP